MQLLVIQLIQTFAGQDDHIYRRQLVLGQAKRLANDTPNAVAMHSSPDIFFGDHKPDAGVIESVGAGKDEDLLVWYLQRYIIEDTLKTPAS